MAPHDNPAAGATRTARATRGDAALQRGIARWRGATARLVVMLNAQHAGPAVAGELHAMARQCERLASNVHQAAELARSSAPGRATR